MKACRVCLAMNVKMYHMSEHKLSVMYEKVTGVQITPDDKLPQMLCWECVARLSAANMFLEKAFKTQWILMNKLKSTGFITISDIESIDKAQHQLESTLGFKINKEYDFNLYAIKESDKRDNFYIDTQNIFIKCEPEFGETNDDINNEEEQIIVPEVNVTDEKDPIKREYVEEEKYVSDEEYKEAVFNEEKGEIKFESENSLFVTFEIEEQEIISEENNVLTVTKDSVLGEVNRWSEIPHYNKLGVDVDDMMLTSSKHNTQDPLRQFRAHSSKDTGIAHHSQIKQEILEEENHFVEKITINVPSISTGTDDRLLQEHTKSSKKLFICDICDKEFEIKSNLTRHLQNHPIMHSCTYCDYKSCAKSTLTAHVNAKHTRKNVYNCPYCNHVAYYKNGLTRHVNSKHTKREVYTCSLCSYTTHDKGILTRHVNAKHTKTNIYNCSYCNYKAYTKWNLSTHVNVKHTKSKVYNCTYCNHRAYNKCALTRHINAKHTKKDVYICSHCNYKTFDKSCLMRHVNAIHTKTITYSCSVCSYISYLKSGLSRHFKAKHANSTAN